MTGTNAQRLAQQLNQQYPDCPTAVRAAAHRWAEQHEGTLDQQWHHLLRMYSNDQRGDIHYMAADHLHIPDDTIIITGIVAALNGGSCNDTHNDIIWSLTYTGQQQGGHHYWWTHPLRKRFADHYLDLNSTNTLQQHLNNWERFSDNQQCTYLQLIDNHTANEPEQIDSILHSIHQQPRTTYRQ